MFRAFLLFLCTVLVLSALITPAVYTLIHLLSDGINPWPFSRVFDRVVMVVAVIYLFLFRKQFSLHEVQEAFCARSWRSELIQMPLRMLLTFLVSIPVLVSLVDDEALMWTAKPTSYVLSKMLAVIPAALLISVIEESFFRLIILKNFSQKFAFPMAATLSSLLYAVAHFVSPVKTFQYSEFDLFAGFRYLGVLTSRFGEPGVLEAGLGLFLVGLVLCYALKASNSIYLCIGLHAGWVVIMKFAHYATEVVPGYHFPSGIGRRYFLVAEPLSWVSIGIVWLVLFAWFSIRRGGHESYVTFCYDKQE
jgi:uncharacterized protein